MASPHVSARHPLHLARGVVSVFLLGLAWWYRQPDEGEAPVAQKADQAAAELEGTCTGRVSWRAQSRSAACDA